jgi:DNA modification methylase
MKIIEVEIDKLKFAEYNPRIITKEEFEGLKASIQSFNFVDPIIINKDYTIIGGHQRTRAAKDLGFKTVPCNILDLDKTNEKKLNVILNSQAISGKYDELKLSEILEELKLENDYLELRLDQLEPLDLSEEGIIEEDDFDGATPEEPKTVLGDLYELNGHRVMCGDSTSIDDIDKLMNGKKADMVFTDPPYGMNYSGRGRKTSNTIMGDNIDPTEFYNLGQDIPERYIWGRVENYKHLIIEPRDVLIWKKNNFGMGKGYRGQYECCFYYGDFNGSDSDVWEIARDINYQHPTQKPIALCARAIKNSLPNSVIDYFLGSGSTLIACEQTKRICYGMELDPKYCDVIIKRYCSYMLDKDKDFVIKRNGEIIDHQLFFSEEEKE